jgi:hypothetical protein
MNYEVTVLEYGKYVQATEWLMENVNKNNWQQEHSSSPGWIFLLKYKKDAFLLKMKWG